MPQNRALEIPARKFMVLAAIEHTIFAVPVLGVLWITRIIPADFSLSLILIFSVLGAPLSAGIAWLIARGSSWVNTRAAIIACGVFPGQVYGLLFGGMLGYHFGGEINGIILAIGFWVAGAWAGAKMAEFLYRRTGLVIDLDDRDGLQ